MQRVGCSLRTREANGIWGTDMRHSAILDIGSSKVICMVVSSESDGAIIVHGIGSKEYEGYRFGSLPDGRALAEAVEFSVRRAERDAQMRIRSIFIGVPSPFMRLYTQLGEVEVRSSRGRVTDGDVEELLENSLDFPVPEGYKLMHSTPVAFKADRSAVRGSPVGLPAKWLSADVSHCFVDSSFRELAVNAILPLGITAEAFISTAFATACFAVPDDDRLSGAVLIDCGGSHTDITLFRGSAPVACDSIGVGGRHITSDICYGLRVPEPVAEDIKKRYVFSLDYGDSVERVRIPNEGVFAVEHSLIQLIIESRTEELCEMIGDSIAAMDADGAGVWLVGGGLALMRGSKEFLSRRIGRDVAVTMPWMSTHSSVNYAAAFGLADFALFRCGAGNAVRGGRRNAFSRGIKEIFTN